MVIVEALSAGTPVIAFTEGAAPEIVEDGLTGFLVADEDEMATAVKRLDRLDPVVCRRRAAERFGIQNVAAQYEAAYRAVIGFDRAPVPVETRMRLSLPNPRRSTAAKNDWMTDNDGPPLAN